MALESYIYGTSKLYLFQNGVAVPQPVEVGTSQDFSIDLDWGNKPLQGRNDASSAIARGALKVSGKIKAARFRLKDLNNTVLGATLNTGSTQTSDLEGAPTGSVIPASVPLTTNAVTNVGSPVLNFAATTGVVAGQSASGTNIPAGSYVISTTSTTVTINQNVTTQVANSTLVTFGPSITVANAATFVADGGVIYAATGIQLTAVASAPTTGQYTVANGVYSFAAADVGLYVIPSYTFTKTTGNNLIYYAQPMGYRPTFMIVGSNLYRSNNPGYAGTPMVNTIYNAGIDKFSLDFKNEDWTIPESDWSASADFLNRVFAFSGDVN